MAVNKLLFSLTVLAFSLCAASAADACGWYAISACARTYAGAQDAADNFGGRVVDTDNFRNFAGGYFCAVVGPKTKDAADVTAERMRSRGARDAYIKYSC